MDEGGVSTGRDRAIAAVIPLVVVIVALHQITISQIGDLSPWKGGGFGMFSTADHVDTRVVRTYLDTSAGWLLVDLEASLAVAGHDDGDVLAALRARPDRGQAERWAAALTDLTWHVERGALRFNVQPSPDRRGLAVRTVRVEVWRTHYDVSTNRIRPQRLVVHTIPTGADAP